MISLPSYGEISACYDSLKSAGITSRLIEVRGGLYVKVDGVLPMDSYKIRGVHHYFSKAENEHEHFEVLSAGNLALAVAHECQKRGAHLTALVPAGISEIKKTRLLALGVEVREIAFDEIWKLVLRNPKSFAPNMIHPLHPDLLCGYGTVVLESLEQLPRLRAMTVPYGLGGLAAATIQAASLHAPEIKIYPVEIEGFSPLERAIELGHPSPAAKLTSFIEALGTPEVIPSVYDFIKERVDQTVLVSETEVKSVIKELHRNFAIRAEGAAAAALAGALKIATSTQRPVVAHLTGANITQTVLEGILHE